MSITLRQLQIFRKLAYLKSYSKTAEALFMTQPGVSIQVKQLAETLNLNIVQTIGKQVYITDVGEKLLQKIQPIHDQIDDILQLSDEINNVVSGEFSLGIDPTGQYEFFCAVNDFKKKYPQVDVKLEVHGRDEQLRKMQNNELDFATIGNIKPNINLVKKLMFNYESYIAAPINNKFAGVKNINPRDLKDEIFLVGGSQNRTRQIILDKINPLSRNLMVISNANALKSAVKSGLGITVLFEPLIEPHDNGYVLLDVQGFPLISNINLAARAGTLHNTLPKYFWDFMADYFINNPPKWS